MEIKAVSKCIHNGFNTEETNFDCPVDPIIPVPPLCRCCLIVKQSFHNTGDLMYVHNATVDGQYSYFIIRRSWIPFFI